MPSRLKFIVAYDGAGFAGWQSQPAGNTIQDRLEEALQKICGRRVRVHGAGRTDAGVHALGQCAHIDLPEKRLSPAQWLNALNAHLPSAIRVTRCSYARKEFHARFSAKGKVYRYRIVTGPVLSPFERGRAWHVTGPLDVSLLRSALSKFSGRHDFAAFAARRGKPETSTVRHIRRVRVRRKGSSITIDLEGDGFLYRMVRLMVGAAVQCAMGKVSVSEVAARLAAGRRSGPRPAAPAAGLYLVRVRY